MVYLDNERDLQIYINKILELIIVDISAVILYELQENIRKYTYQFGGENKSYYDSTGNPTEEFLYAFHWEDIKVGVTVLSRQLIYDWSLMMIHDVGDGLPAHKSFDGTDLRPDLANLLNVNGVYGNKKRKEFWEPTLNWVTNNIDKLVIKYAKKYGLHLN